MGSLLGGAVRSLLSGSIQSTGKSYLLVIKPLLSAALGSVNE